MEEQVMEFNYPKEDQIEAAAESLWEYLRHGDDKYQAWLKRALYAFFRNQPRPEIK